jgi:hypothetical protein
MAIYSSPNLSFIDTFVNAASAKDARTQAMNDARMQGVKDLLGAGVAASKHYLRGKIKPNDVDAIGRYQFEIEGDPSVLIANENAKRTEAMNESIRQATEQATKSSELQNAIKQNAIDLEGAMYEVLGAELAYNEAKANQDVAAMEKADLLRKQTQAIYNRLAKEKESLRLKLMNYFGIATENDFGIATEPTETSVESDNNIDADIEAAKSINELDGSLKLLEKEIGKDNIAISESDKEAKANEWLAKLADAKKVIEASNLSTENKNNLLVKIAEMEKKVKDFAKPESKGGQSIVKKKDKAYYQEKLNGKNIYQLEKLGLKFLEEAKNKGATHEKLDKVIKKLQKEG